jgi:hypothetical protein
VNALQFSFTASRIGLQTRPPTVRSPNWFALSGADVAHR